MKEVFEKIVERLGAQPPEQFVGTHGDFELVETIIECCCEIVEQVAEEYGGGWIPCNERLPDSINTCQDQ